MAPIRLALIGLSASAITSWASSGHLPYLLSERGRQRYKIVALLNSSEAAARRAIEDYELDSDVKAYGSPHDLAADPDIDLVACSTRVDVHYDTIKPSVAAGKPVFVEWPLSSNVQRASELAELAKQHNSPTIVGLQARVAPAVRKVKELLQSGVIGKVLSSEVKANTPAGSRNEISEGLAYFLEKKIGGNPITIQYSHMSDYIHSVLGEFDNEDARVQIQRPLYTIIKTDGTKQPTTSDVPDLISQHGTLKPSEYVAEGATLIISYRTGPGFPGNTPFIWTINGEKGEIRVTSERGPGLNAAPSAFPTPIHVHDFATDEVKEIEWQWEEWQEPLNPSGRNIGKLYDLYYEGKLKEYGVADFESAVARHVVIDKLLWPGK